MEGRIQSKAMVFCNFLKHNTNNIIFLSVCVHSVCVFVRVTVYVCACICVQMCVFMFTCVYVCLCMSVHVWECMYVHVYVCLCMLVRVWGYMQVHVCVYVCVCVGQRFTSDVSLSCLPLWLRSQGLSLNPPDLLTRLANEFWESSCLLVLAL